jgi:hypothetical protein
VAAYFGGVDLNVNGLYLRGVDEYLTEAGYAVARLYRWRSFFIGGSAPLREPWPPEPFGEIHVCEVEVYEAAPTYHFVVMVADGKCLDPLTPDPKRLADYFRVLNIAVVVKKPE